MGTVFAIFIIILFLIFAVPFGFLMVYVIKKSTEKKSPAFLAAEKLGMQQKVNELKQKIQPWQRLSITTITNSTLHSRSKGMSRKATGRIQDSNMEPIVAFQQIERGLYTEGHIVAATTAFTIYYVYTRTENNIYYNGQLLGKIDALQTIYDSSNKIIGRTNRINHATGNPDFETYSIFLHDKKVAGINKSTDLESFKRNRLYDRHRRSSGPPVYYTGPKYIYKLVSVNDTITDDELKWVNALGIYECILYSIDTIS